MNVVVQVHFVLDDIWVIIFKIDGGCRRPHRHIYTLDCASVDRDFPKLNDYYPLTTSVSGASKALLDLNAAPFFYRCCYLKSIESCGIFSY